MLDRLTGPFTCKVIARLGGKTSIKLLKGQGQPATGLCFDAFYRKRELNVVKFVQVSKETGPILY